VPGEAEEDRQWEMEEAEKTYRYTILAREICVDQIEQRVALCLPIGMVCTVLTCQGRFGTTAMHQPWYPSTTTHTAHQTPHRARPQGFTYPSILCRLRRNGRERGIWLRGIHGRGRFIDYRVCGSSFVYRVCSPWICSATSRLILEGRLVGVSCQKVDLSVARLRSPPSIHVTPQTNPA